MKKTFLFLCILFFFGKNASAQIQSDSISKIDLLFVGDVMGHDLQIKSAEITKNKSYNYEPCFQYLKPIIEKADLAIANLEVTLPGEPPYRGYPQFRSPDELALALRLAGFDMLVTANNHSNDAGKKGVINTIATAKKYGFYQTGTFKNKKERERMKKEIIRASENSTLGLNVAIDKMEDDMDRLFSNIKKEMRE